jgi:hypothetical protein
MAKHTLSLEAPDTLNSKIFRVVDTSLYHEDVKVECPILNITLPGFTYAVEFGQDDITHGFSLVMNGCDLEIQTSDCGTKNVSLPDGIYVLKYSVSPNDIIYVEYNHLRITQLLNTYKSVLCDLDLADCAPSIETSKKLAELAKIRTYIDAAKSNVETCHNPKKGMELYSYAKKLLANFNCSGC